MQGKAKCKTTQHKKWRTRKDELHGDGVYSRCQFHQHFTQNISYQSVLLSFYLITVWLYNFFAKECWPKAAHKMLMKLTTGRKKHVPAAKTFFCLREMFCTNFRTHTKVKRKKIISKNVFFSVSLSSL